MRRIPGGLFGEMGKRMMYGRNGFDELSRFLLCASVPPLLVCPFVRNAANGYVSLACFLTAMPLVLWGVWRAFSRDVTARARENGNFTSGSLYTGLKGAMVRFSQRGEYRFYRCPGCKRWLRVPRGKGTVEIRCPGCGSVFRKKT